jgi:hypothetical protein
MFEIARSSWAVYRGWRRLGSGLRESIGAAAGYFIASRQQRRRLRQVHSRVAVRPMKTSPAHPASPLYGGHVYPDTTCAAAHGHAPAGGDCGSAGGE